MTNPPYAPQTWTDFPSTSTPLSAARLTTMENGIRDASRFSDTFPRKAGQWYTTTHPVGNGGNIDGGVFGTSAGRVFLTPFEVTHGHNIDRLGITVTVAGAAGKFMRLGVYKHDEDFGSVTQYAYGSVACDSTGEKTVTQSVFLPVGMYWMAVGSNDTAGTVVVRRVSKMQNYPGAIGGPSPLYVYTEWAPVFEGVDLSGELPSTFNLGSASSWADNDIPIMWVRAAL